MILLKSYQKILEGDGFRISDAEPSLKLVHQNCDELGINNKILLKSDIENFSYRLESADLIFLDPPYGTFDLNTLIIEILKKKLLKNDGIGILETSKKYLLKESRIFEIIKEKKNGDSLFYFFKSNQLFPTK